MQRPPETTADMGGLYSCPVRIGSVLIQTVTSASCSCVTPVGPYFLQMRDLGRLCRRHSCWVAYLLHSRWVAGVVGFGRFGGGWEGPDAPRSAKEKMLAGEPYNMLDPDLDAVRRTTRDLVYGFNHAATMSERRAILELLFGGIGDNSMVEPPFHCSYGENTYSATTPT